MFSNAVIGNYDSLITILFTKSTVKKYEIT